MPRMLIIRLGQLVLGGCVIFSIYTLSSWIIIRNQLGDRYSIDAKYNDFIIAKREMRYEDAYIIMSPEYRVNNSISEFQDWIVNHYIADLDPDRLLVIDIFSKKADLYPEYNIYGSLWQNTVILSWEKIDNEWYLTGEINYMLD